MKIRNREKIEIKIRTGERERSMFEMGC